MDEPQQPPAAKRVTRCARVATVSLGSREHIQAPTPAPPGGEWDGGLGVPPSEAQPALQSDAFKELLNKLAWVLGSTYKVQYSSPRHPARAYALRMAKRLIQDHGYPRKIATRPD